MKKKIEKVCDVLYLISHIIVDIFVILFAIILFAYLTGVKFFK